MCVSVQKAKCFASLAAASSLLFGASAQAQGVNVDFGANTTFPAPSNAYGAASGQVGAWNAASSGASGLALVDLSGAASSVTVTEVGSLGDFQFDNAGTSGDDQGLLDDYLDLGAPGNISTTTFSGLANGNYDVYTYSWAADNRTGFCSQVDVPGSTDPQQMVCGAWTGSHAQGVTYAKHNVNVTAGTLSINVEATPTGTWGTINGFQIVPGGGNNSGTTACFGDSGNCPGGVVGAVGQGCPNSNPNGNGALLVGAGNGQFSNDTFSVDITDAAINKPGILITGGAAINYPNGNSTVPDSAGLFCVNPQQRGDLFFSSATGTASRTTFNGQPFGASAQPAGSTTYLQYWFRDPGNANANPGPGAEFNFSNLVEVDWIN